ncbi:MAG TPA: hypothetical protein ENK59_04835 [Thioploca sp.]|nr:hypothetical protein [Thioploca sp.]
MKKIFIIFACLVTIGVVHAEEVDFSSADYSFIDGDTTGDTIVFDGVRVDGYGFSLKEDALKLKFKFDLDSLSFKLDTSDVVPYLGIGVFNGQCMVNDAPVVSVTTNDEGIEVENRQPFYSVNVDTTYKKNGEEFTIIAGDLIESGKTPYRFITAEDKPFVAEFDLQPNQVMSWNVSKSKSGKLMIYELTGPEIQNEDGTTSPGKMISTGTIDGKLMIGPIKIVKAGNYKMQISLDPKLKKTNSFVFKPYNGNAKILKKIINNTRLSEFFEVDTFSCSKFQVSLNRNETLNIPAPKNNDLTIKLINDRSKVVAQTNGKELIYKETDRNNDYYIFMYSRASKRNTYSNKIKIVLEKSEKPKKPKKSKKVTKK